MADPVTAAAGSGGGFMGAAAPWLMGASMVADVIGGNRAKKKQQKLWKDFQRSLVRREAEQTDLERIARGEIQVSLADSKQMFSQTMAAISASDSVASRRLMEDLNRRSELARVRGRKSGMMGSSATSTMALAEERETFRAALDAETRRSSTMAGIMQQQIGVENQLRGDMAESFRNEGRIKARSGAEYRSALENTTVKHTAMSPAVGQLLGQLRGGRGAAEATAPAPGEGVDGAIQRPFNPYEQGLDYPGRSGNGAWA